MKAVNQVFHWMGHYRLLSIGLLFLIYYTSMALSVCLTLSSGLLIPAILSGCMMGRFVGEFFSQYTGYSLDPGTAALIGGASMLCGISRMTLSLAAIILESTNGWIISSMMDILVANN